MGLLGSIFGGGGGGSSSTSVTTSSASQKTATTTGGNSIQGNSNRIGDNTTFGNVSANTTTGSNNTVSATGGGTITYNTVNNGGAQDALAAIGSFFGNLTSGVQSSSPALAGGSGVSTFATVASPKNLLVAGGVLLGAILLFFALRKR